MASIHPREVSKRIGTIRGELKPRGPKGTLSICMIVKNEEDCIERAIRSFLPFADEIIVNDTGSTDRTLEILAGLPKVKVVQSEWEGDFSKARNHSLKFATSEWILWMDADDYVPPDQVEDYLKLKTAPLDRAFGIQVINTQGGMPVGIRFWQIRMFPNHPSIRFERRVHEQVVFSIAKLGLYAFYTNTSVWHMGYEEPELKVRKAQRNLDLLLEEPDRGIDPVVSSQIADSYAILGDWAKAAEAYEEAFAVPECEAINKDIYNSLPTSIGRSYQMLGQADKAMEWFARGHQIVPKKPEPLLHMGEILLDRKDLDGAAEKFHQVLSLPVHASGTGSQYDITRMYSYKHLCDIARSKGDLDALHELSQKFHGEYPKVVESSFLLGIAMLGKGDPAGAARMLEEGLALNPKASAEAWGALVVAYDKAGDTRLSDDARRRMLSWFPAGQGSSAGVGSSAAPLLSVVMIVKNEAANLPLCLQSIVGFWDELIVVDTGSTDNTREIAAGFGATVCSHVWNDDFSAARNASIEAAHGRWILWLDADDRMLPEDKDRIRGMVRENPDRAWALLVKNSTDGGNTGSVFNQIRLFPGGRGVHFDGRVHEQLSDSLSRAGIPIAFSDVRVIHAGYTDPDTVAEKQRRNLRILVRDLEETPSRTTAVKLFSVAGAHFDLKQYTEAEDWYRKAAEFSERRGEDPHIRQAVPIRVASCMARRGEHEAAWNTMVEFLRIHPQEPEAILLAAEIAEARKDVVSAMELYPRLFLFDEKPTLVPVDFQQIRLKAARFLAAEYDRQGNRELALEILRMAKDIAQGHAVGPFKYPSLLFDFELYEACGAYLQFAQPFLKDAEVPLSLGKVYIMLDRPADAIRTLALGAHEYPQNKDILELFEALRRDLGAAADRLLQGLPLPIR